MKSGEVERFRRFVSQAAGLTSAEDSHTEEFRGFCDRGFELLAPKLLQQLKGLRARLVSWRNALISHDLLAIAGLTWDEDAYTELLAWALHPKTDPESTLRRQETWLRGCVRPEFVVSGAATPRTQLRTNDGRPDLVLEYEDCVVVVEAKTGTEEHTTPGGGLQTVSYDNAVRDRLTVRMDTPVHVVLLAPDLRTPANERAVSTTWSSFATCFAESLDSFDLDASTRFSMQTVLTHFMEQARPGASRLASTLDRVIGCLEHPEGPKRDAALRESLAKVEEVLSLNSGRKN